MNSKPLPESQEVEKAMLGEIMLSNSNDFLLTLTPDHFHFRKHRIIFETIVSMRERLERTDPITISAKLKDLNLLEEVGGSAFVSSCPFTPANCSPEKYHYILEEKLKLRKIIDISYEAQRCSYENADSSKIIEKIGNEIINFQKSSNSGNMLKKTASEVKEVIDRKISGEVIQGLQTSIYLWDSMMGGLSPLFYVLAARGGRGKTSMLEQIVDALLSGGNPVLVFQNDMSLNLFILRLACRRANIPFFKYDLNYCSKGELQEIKRNVEILEKSPLYLYSPTGFTIEKFCSIVKIEQRIHGIKAIFLDHVLKLDVGSDYRVGLTMASQRIRNSVEETRIPHVILAQLNRGAHNTERPTPAHIKEFDALYADCDAMVMLWSEKEVQDVPKGEIFPMKFLVNKNRYGTEFEDDIGFDRPFMKFKHMKKI